MEKISTGGAYQVLLQNRPPRIPRTISPQDRLARHVVGQATRSDHQGEENAEDIENADADAAAAIVFRAGGGG